ncbi:hypothetical protein KSC_016510 [Ktedonobacter sp. SOSP1-52]|nr:hypothetical protein KSC_016510 [Ktedonobacter sp. SOSP1-52]
MEHVNAQRIGYAGIVNLNKIVELMGEKQASKWGWHPCSDGVFWNILAKIALMWGKLINKNI